MKIAPKVRTSGEVASLTGMNPVDSAVGCASPKLHEANVLDSGFSAMARLQRRFNVPDRRLF
jgi:hypothetical protein